jgi:hypothetical protein
MYEPGFISQKTTMFIVTAVNTSNLTQVLMLLYSVGYGFWLWPAMAVTS